jgi:glutamine cyclotransferase
METGTVQQRLSLDASVFAEGITIFGERIYQLTWQNHKLFIYDAETFTLIETVPYDGEGWGLTHDDTHLILSDGTARIRFLDPETLAVAREITALDDGEPVDRLNELEYVRDEIWANIWYKNRIVRISPRDGAVLGYIDLSSLVRRSRKNDEDVLNGIAYDAASQRLFVTGKNWSTLYEIRVMAP